MLLPLPSDAHGRQQENGLTRETRVFVQFHWLKPAQHGRLQNRER